MPRPRHGRVVSFCLTLLLLSAAIASAGGEQVRVDERATQFRFEEDQAIVMLALSNETGRALSATAGLELITPMGFVIARGRVNAEIRPGSSELNMALPVSFRQLADKNKLPWFRLRYEVRPDASESFAPASGIVSLSRIAHDIFELHVAGPERVHDGMRYRARVHARHPVTLRPASGVRVEAVALLEDDDEELARIDTRGGVTDSEGNAVVEFDLPLKTEADELSLKVTGNRASFAQTAETDVSFDRLAEIIVTTDKPIYQPGQTVRLRALFLDFITRRALPEAEATLVVTDPDGTDVFRAALKTSRFGVASADWPVAENTRLGEYVARVEIEEGRYENSAGGQSVRISRYELPNFSVKVKPDRSFYLPGESAEVEVRADYVFGRPVTRGRVRVVRESEREWNFAEQRWDAEEEETFEGETDAEGRFIARIDLSNAHEDLADEDEDTRYKDLTFAAYFTDPTTNRTEQRRFDLRVTREAIHVYVARSYRDEAAGFPLRFYVSTFYADGTPARCDVTAEEELPLPEVASLGGAGLDADAPMRAVVLGRPIRTNGFGVAKVSALALPPASERRGDARLRFTARDRKGRTGRVRAEFYQEERNVIIVETDKTLYRAGEPLRVTLTTNVERMPVSVDLWRRGKLIHSTGANVRRGRASVLIPFLPDFKDDIFVTASSLGSARDADGDPPFGVRRVIFPRRRELQLDVHLDRKSYKPGDEARASFGLRTGEGAEVVGALGVVVTDKAVDERARTDQEFGGRRQYRHQLADALGDGESFAGITRRTLDHIDLSKPLPPGFDLAVEVGLSGPSGSLFENFGSHFDKDQKFVFSDAIELHLRPLQHALAGQYAVTREYPKDEQTLRRILSARGIDLESFRDPWGAAYVPRFGVEWADEYLDLVSAGADEQLGTADDFVASRLRWPFMRADGEKIERVWREHHARTGKFIRERAALESEMRAAGVEFSSLRDPWGRPFEMRFGAAGRYLTIEILTGGPDRRFGTTRKGHSDDFTAWTLRLDFFATAERKIAEALDAFYSANNRAPSDESEFRVALARAGLSEELLLDQWAQPLRPKFSVTSDTRGRAIIRSYARHGSAPKDQVDFAGPLQVLRHFSLGSAGPDMKHGTWDDFVASNYTRVTAEPLPVEKMPPLISVPENSGEGGLITGVITDPQGAVIPGATVTIINTKTGAAVSALTNDEGLFTLERIPAGTYLFKLEATGFKSLVMADVAVQKNHVTQVDASLEVGAISEVVMVSAGSDSVDYTSTSYSVAVVESRQIQNLPINNRNVLSFSMLKSGVSRAERRGNVHVVTKSGEQISTPRLREYFPETLLWQPSLETDERGRARLSFRLADNITTWKLSVIGSTSDGELGIAEREIRAFQPFFVDLDPPRVLTEGDRIGLPTVVRNYTEKPQRVALELANADWFSPVGPSRKETHVQPGDASRELFDIRATRSVSEGRQRVTAYGSGESDAVEKTVAVHPDGEEVSVTSGQTGAGALEINFPTNVVAGTARAELKLYPNLLAHVIEGVEGIMQRPYGCGEQTVSSSYPSLIVLRHHKTARGNSSREVVRRAERYVRAGYERLLGYRSHDGGFSYWGRGESDLALTVYALQFLKGARDFIAVDEDVIDSAEEFIKKRQRADGAWPETTGSGPADTRRTALVTAYVARVLALTSNDSTANQDEASVKRANATRAAVKRALTYLAREVEKTDEPFTLASYTLAASSIGDTAAAAVAAKRLAALAQTDSKGAFWEAKSATPFHGWGRAGSIETTALAARALSSASKDEQADNTLVERALYFLLTNKDHFGVWHSTQATANVLDTFTSLHASQTQPLQAAGAAEVFVNGRHAGTLTLPPAGELSAPLTLDLTPFINSPGANRVEVRRPAGASPLAAQVVSNFYVPWADAVKARPSSAATPTLEVRFDKLTAAQTEEVSCRVVARRGASPGFGMLLAEVGLPPGAEVDRSTLEAALKDTSASLDRYDILPDRIVLYLQPSRSNGLSEFTFKFRPRFPADALTAPSQIYDYYNPEARAVVAPQRFVIR